MASPSAHINPQNPVLFTTLIHEWIGFSEHYDSAPVAYKPSATYLGADVEKRDAIVSAFRVRLLTRLNGI